MAIVTTDKSERTSTVLPPDLISDPAGAQQASVNGSEEPSQCAQEDPAAVLTRARGKGGAVQGGDVRAELVLLRQVLSQARSQVNRASWRRAVQARTTTIARVVRVAQRALREPGGRRRVDQGWLLFVHATSTITETVMTVVTKTATRTLADLSRPIPMIVTRPALVDLETLDVLGETISLSISEAR